MRDWGRALLAGGAAPHFADGETDGRNAERKRSLSSEGVGPELREQPLTDSAKDALGTDSKPTRQRGVHRACVSRQRTGALWGVGGNPPGGVAL
jgi:hypothetical protein